MRISRSMISLLIVLFVSSFVMVYAGGTTPSRPAKKDDPYKKGYALVQKLKAKEEAGKLEGSRAKSEYRKALSYFQKAYKKNPYSPDTLNMLAFCQRKTGDFDSAIKNYKKALERRSNFPEAREYLGEAYIQLAMQQVEILKGYGSKGEHALEDLSETIQDAASSLKK